MGLVGIETLTPEAVRNVILAALQREAAGPSTLAGFVAAVDWSKYGQATPLVRDLLGLLELWLTELDEGDLTTEDFEARLQESLQPPAPGHEELDTLAQARAGG